jgi:hypothetical protein
MVNIIMKENSMENKITFNNGSEITMIPTENSVRSKGYHYEINSEELINQWKELNTKANKLLQKHKSFKEYNNVRLKMDEIEDILEKYFNIDVYNM